MHYPVNRRKATLAKLLSFIGADELLLGAQGAARHGKYIRAVNYHHVPEPLGDAFERQLVCWESLTASYVMAENAFPVTRSQPGGYRPLLADRRSACEKRVRSPSTTLCSCAMAFARSGCAKIVRTIAAAGSRAECGIVASRLRMKCTRQRCQLAPDSTIESAFRSPSRASKMTSFTHAVRA